MIEIRKGANRGHFSHGWLDTWHSFSFGDYVDPERMGVSALRVINDDVIAPGKGFPTHPHRDMEIITYVLTGALAHRDSMGNSSVIRSGEVQRMSAGTGITHSEYNNSSTEPVHLLQIWVHPDTQGLQPGYQQVVVSEEEKDGRLRLIAASGESEGRVMIHQDARLYSALLDDDQIIDYLTKDGRVSYLHLARGKVAVNGIRLVAGDAILVQGDESLHISDGAGAELLLFDLP